MRKLPYGLLWGRSDTYYAHLLRDVNAAMVMW
jgi:hypothetical protein